MKIMATTLALALAATLAVPATAQQVRGIDGAIAHFNRSIDSPNDRIRPQDSRLQQFTRSTRSAPRLARPARITNRLQGESARTANDHHVLRRDQTGGQGFSTQRAGLGQAQRLSLGFDNRIAEPFTSRRLVARR